MSESESGVFLEGGGREEGGGGTEKGGEQTGGASPYSKKKQVLYTPDPIPSWEEENGPQN